LAGALLIAHPNLLDPNFRRTVLFIAAHDGEEGALGLVLNRETDQTVGDLVEQAADGPLADLPVFYGGPVGADQLTFVAFRWNQAAQAVECRVNLDWDDARRLIHDDETVVRAFLGYSGWTGGQLEGELEQKAWVVQKPDREILDPEACKQLWFTILKDFGPWFRLLALAPDDPSVN
jgi:putative transcriptional regulator